MSIFMPDPNNIDFIRKTLEFSCKRNFPNCIFGVVGKHIRVRCSSNYSGSLFYNYKDFLLSPY